MPRPTLDAPADASNTLNSLLAANHDQKDSKNCKNAWGRATKHARPKGVDSLPLGGLERWLLLTCRRHGCICSSNFGEVVRVARSSRGGREGSRTERGVRSTLWRWRILSALGVVSAATAGRELFCWVRGLVFNGGRDFGRQW